MSHEFQTINSPFLDGIKKNSSFVITMGIILILVGMLSIGAPFVMGVSLVLMIGIMLIIGGMGHLVIAVKTDKGLLSIIIGLLTAFIGIYMISNPGAALGSLTIILAAYLIVSGVFEILMAYGIRPANGWGWMLFSGIISMLLGVLIWNQFPLSGVWAIGVLIGLRLLFSGWAFLMFGLAARSLKNV